MNVYSIRFFPKLKIKFCQLFGIANVMAIEELDRRAARIEGRISQLHRYLKLHTKRELIRKAEKKAKPKRKPIAQKSKPVVKKQTKAKKPTLAKVREISRPTLVEKPAEENLVAEEIEEVVMPPVMTEAPVFEEVVILIQPEEDSRRAVQGFFGADVTLIELETLQHLEGHFEGKKVLAVIFDRMLLSQEQAFPIFEKLNEKYPATKMIGLSQYLTLALAESFPHRNDFATFTSRPLSVNSLNGIFGGNVKRA